MNTYDTFMLVIFLIFTICLLSPDTNRFVMKTFSGRFLLLVFVVSAAATDIKLGMLCVLGLVALFWTHQCFTDGFKGAHRRTTEKERKEFRDNHCDHDQLMWKGQPVNSDMSTLIFRQLKQTKHNCNPCDASCKFALNNKGAAPPYDPL